MMIQLLINATALDPAVSAGDFSFWSLFLRADWVVKGVMILLALASVWSWAIAVNKLFMFYVLRRKATDFEDTFWSGRTLDDLSTSLGSDTRDPMARIFSAAMREYKLPPVLPRPYLQQRLVLLRLFPR